MSLLIIRTVSHAIYGTPLKTGLHLIKNIKGTPLQIYHVSSTSCQCHTSIVYLKIKIKAIFSDVIYRLGYMQYNMYKYRIGCRP